MACYLNYHFDYIGLHLMMITIIAFIPIALRIYMFTEESPGAGVRLAGRDRPPGPRRLGALLHLRRHFEGLVLPQRQLGEPLRRARDAPGVPKDGLAVVGRQLKH